MSFKNIKESLNRDEIKKIMAGSGEYEYCGYCDGRACYRDPHAGFACNAGGVVPPVNRYQMI